MDRPGITASSRGALATAWSSARCSLTFVKYAALLWWNWWHQNSGLFTNQCHLIKHLTWRIDIETVTIRVLKSQAVISVLKKQGKFQKIMQMMPSKVTYAVLEVTFTAFHAHWKLCIPIIAFPALASRRRRTARRWSGAASAFGSCWWPTSCGKKNLAAKKTSNDYVLYTHICIYVCIIYDNVKNKHNEIKKIICMFPPPKKTGWAPAEHGRNKGWATSQTLGWVLS